MQGRYGGDDLYVAITTLCLVLLILNNFLRSRALSWLIMLLLIYNLYRAFSKKHALRQKENEIFISLASPLQNYFRKLALQLKDREHSYYLCPKCHKINRIPKKQGAVTITCVHCAHEFEKKN